MENNVNVKIDWKALDIYWAECYEEDYGHLFSCCSGNNGKYKDYAK